MFADLDPWYGGRDRLEFPAYFGRGIGFHVKRVELAWSSPHEQKNAAFGPDGQGPSGAAKQRVQGMIETESEHRQGAGLENLTAISV